MPATKTKPTITPLMQQYLQIKARYADEILFFRLGDFYELFFDDAIKAAPIMEVALTKRQTTPMCGVPHHSVTGYIAKLLKEGMSVAMAEQLEDPKKTKGMVKRDVVRVITPGTIVEDELLPSKANNFLVSLVMRQVDKKGIGHWALFAADISTGRQWIGEVKDDLNWNQLKAQLASLNPSEILVVGEDTQKCAALIDIKTVFRLEPVPSDARSPEEQAKLALRSYLERHHASSGQKLSEPLPLPLSESGTLFLDESAIRHLELVDSADPFKQGPTLLSVLDRTVTPLGSRLLQWWILHPSCDLKTIESRQNQIQDMVEAPTEREALREPLREISDLERILVRAQAGSASPRDLGALRHSLLRLPEIQQPLIQTTFKSIRADLNPPANLIQLLQTQLADELPAKIADGGMIREGVNAELDELRDIRRHGRKWIAQMEADEKTKTGITNLKVGYNDVFGYYLEVSKSHLAKVPSEWIRKQTLANAERFITPSLKEQEEKILGAQDKIQKLELKLFQELVTEVAAFAPSVSKTSQALAHLDVVASLSTVAAEQGYVRPKMVDDKHLEIQNGRHPVIEKQIGRDRFIPNDVHLGGEEKQICIITGPNMAGKSTYLRQTALIVIMAQVGSFIPAEGATIGLVDRIFTRIGASDRLSQGQSTFMVEMTEVATLLQNSTPRSLLVLDEVGRGTSTYDGVSIAWAVIDHLSKNNGTRTLFATHYFELTQLADLLPNVKNAHATAKEWPGPDGRRQVVFLYQIQPGPADRSYGIHVAEMAGIPETCIDRARNVLSHLESGNHQIASEKEKPAQAQLDLFGSHPVVDELKKLNVEHMTPIEALTKLSELRKKVD